MALWIAVGVESYRPDDGMAGDILPRGPAPDLVNTAWRDNVFVERLLGIIEYAEVFLRGYAGILRGTRLDRPLSRLLQQPEVSFVA